MSAPAGYDRAVPEVAFVMSPRQHQSLRELAEALGTSSELQAVPARCTWAGFPEPRPDRVYVLLDPRGYVAAEGAQALPDDSIMARTVLLCAEPPPTDSGDPHLEVLRRAGAVFAIDQRAVVALSRLGVRARLVRPGYTRVHDHFDPGTPTPDRRAVPRRSHAAPDALSRPCRARPGASALRPAPRAGGAGRERDAPVSADRRWPLLEQAKVLINLHSGESTRVEWRPVLDAIHAGAVVVTEHSSGMAPLVAGEHLLVASADSMPFVAETPRA